MKRIPILACVFCITFVSAALASDPVQIVGTTGQVTEQSVDQIRKTFAGDVQQVQTSSHGTQHQYNCVPLLDAMKIAGAPTELKMDPKADPHVKNYPLRLVVIVTGKDGYSAVLSMGELLADVGHHAAWLALDMDGQPLSDKEGPFKLLVPDDAKPARWVRNVTRIEVRDLSASAKTQRDQSPINNEQ